MICVRHTYPSFSTRDATLSILLPFCALGLRVTDVNCHQHGWPRDITPQLDIRRLQKRCAKAAGHGFCLILFHGASHSVVARDGVLHRWRQSASHSARSLLQEVSKAARGGPGLAVTSDAHERHCEDGLRLWQHAKNALTLV